jgi:Tfp pilus assembly protein PilF
MEIMKRNTKLTGLSIAGIFLLLFLSLPGCKDSGDGPRLDPLQEKAREHYLKGRRLFLTCDPNNYPLAIEEFQQALAYWEDYPEALAAFAETYSMYRGFNLTEQEFGDSYKSAQRALRLNPELASGYRAIADLFRHKAEHERALRQIETAIQLEPDNAENYYVKGSTLLSQDPRQAILVLNKAITLNPDLPKIYFNLSAGYHLLGEFDNARDAMLRYQEMVPNDPSGNSEMGLIYLDMGKIEDAITEFQRAVAQPHATRPWEKQWLHRSYYQLGVIYFEHKKDINQALEYLLKAEEILPNNLETSYYTGLVYAKLGKNKTAAKYLHKALNINPEFQPALDALDTLP